MVKENRRIFTFIGFLALTVLLVEVYLLDLYHEEPRRLLVAVSMLDDSQWVIPHILGEVYLKKPPGYNWAVALLSLPFGTVTKISGRIVSVLSWIFIGGIVWSLAEEMRPKARFVAVCSILFSVVFYVEKAALAEIDVFFTALLTGAIWVFYRGVVREKFSSNFAWIGSHILFALAVLTKGPVAYLFFYLPITVLFFLRSKSLPIKWRSACLGVFIGHLIIASWAIAFFRSAGIDQVYDMVIKEMVSRGEAEILPYFEQLIYYPIMVFLSIAPWCFIVLGIVDDDVRKEFHGRIQKSIQGNLIVAGLVPFLIFYVFPVDNVRYVLPIFPYIALGIGLFVEVILDIDEEFILMVFKGLNCFLGGTLAALVFLPWGLNLDASMLSFPWIVAGSFVLSISGAILLFCSLGIESFSHQIVAVLSFMILLKLGYLFIFIPVEEPQRMRSRNIVEEFISSLNIDTKRSVAFNSDQNLEIPYYFLRNGHEIRKVTGSNTMKSYPYVISTNRPTDGRILGKLRLHNAPIYYFYKQTLEGSVVVRSHGRSLIIGNDRT